MLDVFTYQIIIIIISILAISFSIKKYYENNFSLATFVAWILIWILVIVISLFPSITTPIASLFGLGRGLDALYIAAIILSYYAMFKLYNKMDNQRKRIDELVSEIAIYNNEQEDDN